MLSNRVTLSKQIFLHNIFSYFFFKKRKNRIDDWETEKNDEIEKWIVNPEVSIRLIKT